MGVGGLTISVYEQQPKNNMRQFWIVLFICIVCVSAKPKSGRRKKNGDDQASHTYKYGYKITDEDRNKQTRKEESDGQGNVKGTYGYTDADGIYRQVEYTAGPDGFKAWVKTNEPGTVNANPADADIISEYEADDDFGDDDEEDWEDDEDWAPTTKAPSRRRFRPSGSSGKRQQSSWSGKGKGRSRSSSRRSKSSGWD